MNNLRNKVHLIGRIGQKPELQTLAGDNKWARFSLATNESFKDKDGNWKENTQWHNIKVWGRIAERLVTIVEKGNEIALEGKLVNRNYETQAGEKKYITEIEMSDFIIINNVQNKK
jgi:single-strand DNA-binding protein